MKKSNSVRQLLGLTQLEMAMLLKITRAQWSMYECNKRRLPLAAAQLLADIVSHLDLRQSEDTVERSKGAQNAQIQIHIERLLNEVDFQLLKTKRKLAVIERKLNSELRVNWLANSLRHRDFGDRLDKNFGAEHIELRAKKEAHSPSLIIAFNLSHKLQMLEFEKQTLESKLDK